MRIKRKNGLKMIVIALVLLLCLALAVGITGAYYQAKRQATGTLNMDQGIVIDYKGFDKTTAEDWATWTRGVTLPLFETTDAQPGEHITVNAAGIRANTESVDFYARVKLSYKFYNNDTEVTLANASDLITTSANFFGTNWVDGGSNDGYYYYATGTTLNKFEKGTQTFVDLFATDAEFIIEGENFTGATSDGEGGGFVVGDTSINKIEVYLTLETLQGDADAAAEGWKITASSDDPTEDIEDFSKNKLLDSNGDEIDSNSTDLIEDTVYQVVDESGNGYKFTYKLDETNMTATITGPAGSPTTLDIPNKIVVQGKNYTVTAIGMNAFVTCSSLLKVTIPNSVIKIGDRAFCNIGLTDVIIKNGVTSIGEESFGNCDKLSSVIIPDSVTSIGVDAFYGCSGLTSITIPNKITNIEDGVFSHCSGLTSIKIPDSVIKIGNSSFASCSGLTTLVIPKNVTSIGDWAFQGCSGLKSIIVASQNAIYHSVGNCLIETASKTLIAGCEKSIIPTNGSVVKIGASAFEDCSGLTSITIPDAVTSIADHSFCNSGIISISIPDNVTSIGDYAFQNCSELKEVIIGKGIKNIEYQTFAYCDKLSSVTMFDNVLNIKGGAFIGCSNLTSITIPNSVTSISNSAFSGCGFTSIIIPDSVISIEGYVFYGCTNLTTTIGEGWVKASDNSAVDASTLLKDIDYAIKRV